MSEYEDLLGAIDDSEPPGVTGQWFNIRFTPDLATGERFNIGVAFVAEKGHEIHVRMLNHVDRIRCLYSATFADDVGFMLEVVKSSLRYGGTEKRPSPNIEYSSPKYAAGESVDAILARLYRNTVPLGAELERPERFRGSDNESVRRAVFDTIRQRSSLGAEKIIAPDPVMLVEEGNKRHTLDIPLQGTNMLGTVVSAIYKSKDRAEINLLRASLDLETASRIYRQDNLGLFIAMPSVVPRHFPQKRVQEIENVVDMVAWKMAKQRVHVHTDEDLEGLASNIISWGGIG